jgi:septal ring factor EnvC (AmiA/AmiB activator)
LLTLAATQAAPAADDQAKLEQVRQQIAELARSIEGTTQQRDQERAALREIEKRLAELGQRLADTTASLAEASKQLHQARQRAAELERTLAGQKARLASELRDAYMQGRQPYLKLLLNAEDPALVSRHLAYYGYFRAARATRIQAWREALAELEAARRAISQREAELQALHAGQQRDQAQNETARKQRRVIVLRLETALQDQQQRLTGLRQDEERLRSLLAGLTLIVDELAAPAGEAFAQTRGKLALPVSARPRARYGTPRQGGLRWEGLFFDLEPGQEVRAIFRGRVAFADWFGGLGLLVIVDHGDGYMSLYGHNQALLVQTGDWIEAGQELAVSGESGGLARPGLYFELRHNGRPRNPLEWCRLG